MRRQSASDRGFTIVEVLIVLAIAGLIIMLIFLAIPTLQRSSRNNQRKNGAANVLTAIHTYALNNSGVMAPNCGSSDPACAAYNQVYHNEKIAYYDGTNGADFIVCVGSYSGGILSFGDLGNTALCNVRNAGSTSQAVVTDVDHVYVYNYQRCDHAHPGAGTSQGAGYSDVVALFALETGGGGTAPQCQEI